MTESSSLRPGRIERIHRARKQPRMRDVAPVLAVMLIALGLAADIERDVLPARVIERPVGDAGRISDHVLVACADEVERSRHSLEQGERVLRIRAFQNGVEEEDFTLR